jgi:hypothetical protein
MIAKNQIVVISGILVLLATATIAAATYNVQIAKAAQSNFGQDFASPQAHANQGLGPHTVSGPFVSCVARSVAPGSPGTNGLC